MNKPSALTDDSKATIGFKYASIKIGIDWHAKQYCVCRIIDNGAPEPAQRFKPHEFLRWVKKQQSLATRVVTCYEAGAGGFVLHRQLTALGVENLVVAPRKLDPGNRRVINDKTDARELTQELDRYVRGNNKALRVVYVPSEQAEQARHSTRQRKQFQKQRLSVSAQGRAMLLSHGFHESNQWWKRWESLQSRIPGWMVPLLEAYLKVILELNTQIEILIKAICKETPKNRPKGMGALTYEEITREVCDFNRFKNRKAPGSYVGLTGGVSSSGESHQDLPITKAGSSRLRTILVETAWRFSVYQPESRTMAKWSPILRNPNANKRSKKRAVVAAARQLFVDFWRLQTGRTDVQQLGWIMTEEASIPAM
jgi:transposase